MDLLQGLHFSRKIPWYTGIGFLNKNMDSSSVPNSKRYAWCSFLGPFLFRSPHLPVTRHLRPPQLSNNKVKTHVYRNSCTFLWVKIKQWPPCQNPEGRPVSRPSTIRAFSLLPGLFPCPFLSAACRQPHWPSFSPQVSSNLSLLREAEQQSFLFTSFVKYPIWN